MFLYTRDERSTVYTEVKVLVSNHFSTKHDFFQ